MQGPDKTGSKCGERHYDDACHRGVTKWSGLPRADGQEGDQFIARKGSTIMEDPCWLMAKLMVAGEVEESSEANSM